MDLGERCLEQTYRYRGMVNLREDRVRLPNGEESGRVVVEHPGAAAVVATDSCGKLVLVRQFRYPIGEDLLEIPAGKLDGSEDPETCARRELKEETGFVAAGMVSLGSFFTSPGFCNERIHLFWAGSASEGDAVGQDPDEFLQLIRMDPAEAIDMAKQGRVPDFKTACGILAAAARGLL